jgi:hypothetical protein
MSKAKDAPVHMSQELPREQPMPRFDYQTPPTTRLEVSVTCTSSSERPRPVAHPQKIRSLQNLHF